MKSEDLIAILQLLKSMQETTEKLEKAMNKRDVENFNKAKEEILRFQKEIVKIAG